MVVVVVVVFVVVVTLVSNRIKTQIARHARALNHATGRGTVSHN